MRTTENDRKYINAEKEYILSDMYLIDAGYSLQDIITLEENIDTDTFFKGKNDMEKRYCKAYAAESKIIHKLVDNEGYTTEDFQELYEIAENEAYNEKAEEIVYKF